jgi:hypothetical protein
MQKESAQLKSKAQVTARRRIVVPLLDESRGRSAILLKIIALLLFAGAGLVCFTASGLSQGQTIGFDGQISENAQQMMTPVRGLFRTCGAAFTTTGVFPLCSMRSTTMTDSDT